MKKSSRQVWHKSLQRSKKNLTGRLGSSKLSLVRQGRGLTQVISAREAGGVRKSLLKMTILRLVIWKKCHLMIALKSSTKGKLWLRVSNKKAQIFHMTHNRILLTKFSPNTTKMALNYQKFEKACWELRLSKKNWNKLKTKRTKCWYHLIRSLVVHLSRLLSSKSAWKNGSQSQVLKNEASKSLQCHWTLKLSNQLANFKDL